ncbi:MAG: hypothetical protein ACO4AM_07830, partial [Candidatus Nanopelagicaceae bacterium]
KGQKMSVQVTFNASKNRYEGFVNGKKVSHSVHKDYVENKVQMLAGRQANVQKALQDKRDEFGINKRFDFVKQMVGMVASKTVASAIITGQGGLGKSHTVLKALESEGLQNVTDLADFEVGSVMRASKCYRIVKGFSTAKGLYRTLFEANKMTLVFDDCDSVLKDPVALNVLKGALDSYSDRYISWNADMKDDDLPRTFKFEGSIVFISNMELDRVDQAIRSRAMCVDLSMTQDQKIERMAVIAADKDFLPEYSDEVKADALAFIGTMKDQVENLSLRSLIAVSKIRATAKDWKDLAKYVLTQGA